MSSEGFATPQKSFTRFFMRFEFVFCSEGTKTIEAIKIAIVFDVIPLNNAFLLTSYFSTIMFIQQDNAIPLRWESLKQFVSHSLSCILFF